MSAAQKSLISALRVLATEYQTEANAHDHLSDVEALERAACTLRLAAVLVQEGLYSLDLGYAWLDAGCRILTAIQDAKAHA